MDSGGDGDEMEMTAVELRSWIRERVENNGVVVHKKTQLAQMQNLIKRREKQATGTRILFKQTCQSVVECEGLMKELYSKLDMVYRDTDSEDDGEASQPASVNEIANDDNVMDVDSAAPKDIIIPDNDSEINHMVVDTPSKPSSPLEPIPSVTAPPNEASGNSDGPVSHLTKSPEPNGCDSETQSQTEPQANKPRGLRRRREQEKMSSEDEWDPQSEKAEVSEGDSNDSLAPQRAKGKTKKRKSGKRPTPSPAKVRGGKKGEETKKKKRKNASTKRKKHSGEDEDDGDDGDDDEPETSHNSSRGPSTAKIKPQVVNKGGSTAPSKPEEESRGSAAAPAKPKEASKDKCSPVVVMSVSQIQHNPATQPPPGLKEQELKLDMVVLARRRTKTWHKGRIKEIKPVGEGCKYKVDFGEKGRSLLSGHHIAFDQTPLLERLYVGARVVSTYKDRDESWFYSGILAELPNRKNRMRFLVFFDDCTPCYVSLPNLYLVCRPMDETWKDIEDEGTRDFIKDYLKVYPNPPMAQYKLGQKINIEFEGVQRKCEVEQIDSSLIYAVFLDDEHKEWVYRGSLRLEHMTNMRRHLLETKKDTGKRPCVGAVTSTINSSSDAASRPHVNSPSTATPAAKRSPPTTNASDQTGTVSEALSEGPVVVYTPHRCCPACLDRLRARGETNHRGLNPLGVPMLYDFCRMKGRQKAGGKRSSHMSYRSPCGLNLNDMSAVQDYLQQTRCDFLFLEMFCLDPHVSVTATYEPQPFKIFLPDLTLGKETQPLSCINELNSLRPPHWNYSKNRVASKGVSINTSLDFLVGCDCTDGCRDRSGCSCHQMMVQATALTGGGTEYISVGYTHKRLEKPLVTGVYECNALCRCDPRVCSNRVVQQGPQLRLQLFMTLCKGWGIRCLDDVAKGSFICTYAGTIRPSASAESSVYNTKLNHIEGAESHKEGYESEAQCSDREMEEPIEDNDNIEHDDDDDDEEGGKGQDKDAEEDEGAPSEYDVSSGVDSDDNFEHNVSSFVRSYITRRNAKILQEGPVRKTGSAAKSTDSSASVDGPEEDSNTTRCFFDNEKSCYIIDANMQGNLGRYLNHSCSPNLFVQNVFVDTHDLRFPWVAFFTSKRLKAGTELTWDYRSEIGCLEKNSKQLFCRCGSNECRGKL